MLYKVSVIEHGENTKKGETGSDTIETFRVNLEEEQIAMLERVDASLGDEASIQIEPVEQ